MSSHFSLSRLEVSGDATPIAQGVIAFPTEAGPTAFASFSTSNNGTLIYRIGNKLETQLTWFDRAGKSEEKIFDPGVYHEPSLTPDGKKIILSQQDEDAQDLFVLDISRNSPARLTFDPQDDVSSVISPDGSQIIYASNRSGKFDFYQKSSSGAGSDQLILTAKSSQYPDSWSPDGKSVIYSTFHGELNVISSEGGESHLLAYLPRRVTTRSGRALSTASRARRRTATAAGTRVMARHPVVMLLPISL